jgi:hypothetical protein
MDDRTELKLSAWRARRRQLAPYADTESLRGNIPEHEREFLHAHRMVEALEAAWAYEKSLDS